MASSQHDTLVRQIQGGVLSWILPGAGHWYLGQRDLAVVVFVAVSFPYWCGLAIGGLKDCVNPRTNRWLYLAEAGVGGYTLPLTLGTLALERNLRAGAARGEAVDEARYSAYYPESDVAQIYLATAGLLNVLVILDAIARAQTGGLPTHAPGNRASGAVP